MADVSFICGHSLQVLNLMGLPLEALAALSAKRLCPQCEVRGGACNTGLVTSIRFSDAGVWLLFKAEAQRRGIGVGKLLEALVVQFLIEGIKEEADLVASSA